jgi:hypothetical protein
MELFKQKSPDNQATSQQKNFKEFNKEIKKEK